MLAVERGQEVLEHLRRELVVDRDVAVVVLLEDAGDARREQALLRGGRRARPSGSSPVAAGAPVEPAAVSTSRPTKARASGANLREKGDEGVYGMRCPELDCPQV